MKTVAIGSGAMSWGDILEPSLEMANKANVQYISFDFLGELTMSLLYTIRLKNPGGDMFLICYLFSDNFCLCAKRGELN